MKLTITSGELVVPIKLSGPQEKLLRQIVRRGFTLRCAGNNPIDRLEKLQLVERKRVIKHTRHDSHGHVVTKMLTEFVATPAGRSLVVPQ